MQIYSQIYEDFMNEAHKVYKRHVCTGTPVWALICKS